MILGQLIQAGKQFCECRSREFLPESDFHHTFVAYNVMDALDCRVFETDEIVSSERIREWLIERDSIAYFVISRNFDNKQDEFPAPLGQSLEKRVTITAATDTMLGQMSFVVRGDLAELPIKLISTRGAGVSQKLLLKNQLKQEEPEDASLFENVQQFSLSDFVDQSLLVG